MPQILEQMQKKNFEQADEVRKFDKGKVEMVTVGDATFGKATLQPGWKWVTSVKPIVHTESCQAIHHQFHLAGQLHVVMDDGVEEDFGPGDVSFLPSGHKAWVVGDEPVVLIDISGTKHYAQPTE